MTNKQWLFSKRKNDERFLMTRKIFSICWSDKLNCLESYFEDNATIDISPRVFAANVQSVFTAFYVSFREGWPRLSFAPAYHPAHFFSTGVFMGLLYDRSGPLGRSHTRTRYNTCTPAYDSVRMHACVRVRPLRIGACEVVPSRTTLNSIYNACGTIKKYPWSENKSNLWAERLADQPRSLNAR